LNGASPFNTGVYLQIMFGESLIKAW
jgi:hypothetical protein